MNNICKKIALILLLSISFNGYSQSVKKNNFSVEEDTKIVKSILKKIDADATDTSIYSDDIVHMAQGSRPITNKAQLYTILKAEASYGRTEMTHEILDLKSYPDMVFTRGRAKGTYYPNDGGRSSAFETNNIITFNRTKNGSLKVSQVIFNRIDLIADLEQANPFKKFFGEWTLKGDNWSHNWGNGTENIKIPGHYTLSKPINTINSVLSVIDTEPKGHILWSYNPVKKEVRHLSSFGTSRIGVGKGTIDENGNLTLKVSFEGETEGSYRIYNYKWISDNEYELKSVQYNDKNEPTGLFYSGNFVRIK